MSRTLTIPDARYEQFEAEARTSGVSNVEHYTGARTAESKSVI